MLDLTPENAWLFRITHIANVPWVLAKGLYCCNSKCLDPNFQEIGNPEVIGKRTRRQVLTPPGGVLSDYIPFYFTPYSPMLLNIKTGYQGLKMTPMPDIAIIFTSLHKIRDEGVGYVFSDRMALVATAQFFSDLRELDNVDWPLLKSRNFKRDPDDPGKVERYMAEALIHQYLPVKALLGIACHGPAQQKQLQDEASRLALTTPIVVQPGWYF